MNNTMQHLIGMGGYGLYVWGSYGVVVATLAVQWFIPWHRRKQYLTQQNSHE